MKKILTVMATMLSVAAGAQGTDGAYPFDVIETRNGGKLKIVFFAHGSLAFEYEGRHIYIDPVSDYADYDPLPKADLILVSHEHSDHLDPAAIEAVSKPETVFIGNGTAVEGLGYGEVLSYGKVRKLSYASVEAVPAYNTSPEQLQFHPKARLHNGYVITFGGTRVYIAGDTEDTPEMMALKNIDIAFLPINRPYTMKEEQAARAIRAIKPAIFYPYHYGGSGHTTDLAKVARLLEGSGVDLRIEPLE